MLQIWVFKHNITKAHSHIHTVHSGMSFRGYLSTQTGLACCLEADGALTATWTVIDSVFFHLLQAFRFALPPFFIFLLLCPVGDLSSVFSRPTERAYMTIVCVPVCLQLFVWEVKRKGLRTKQTTFVAWYIHILHFEKICHFVKSCTEADQRFSTSSALPAVALLSQQYQSHVLPVVLCLLCCDRFCSEHSKSKCPFLVL